MGDALDINGLAAVVYRELEAAPQGVVVSLLKDGSVRLDRPVEPVSGWERKERPVATFVRTLSMPEEHEVRGRIAQGLRKLGLIR